MQGVLASRMPLPEEIEENSKVQEISRDASRLKKELCKLKMFALKVVQAVSVLVFEAAVVGVITVVSVLS